MIARQALTFWIVAGVCLTAAPATAQYRVDHWTTDDGLPQNSVLALLQTRDGYLWAATPDGLVRFDGLTFTIYNKATTPGLTTNRFNALFESADGALWIGTEDRGVVRYRAGTFDAFDRDAGLPPSVWNIRAAPDGRVIVHTHFGAAVFDGTRFERTGPSQSHQAIARWAPGTRLQPAAIVRFDGRDVVRYPYPPGVAMPGVGRVVEDNLGGLWLVTVDGEYHRDDDGWAPVPQVRPFVREPRAILIDTRGRHWMPVPGGVAVSERDGLTTGIDLGLDDAGDGIYTMLEDREGSLWLGTIRSGLFRIRRQTIDVIARQEGLADDNVYPLTEDAAGRVWVGTWNGGLHRSSADGIRPWTPAAGRLLNQISALHADADGTLIVGVLHHGIVIIGPDERVRLRLGERLPNRVVSVITRDRAGTLWLGTNAGLVAVRDGAVERTLTVADGLPDRRVISLLRARDDNVWIGTLSGVARLSNGVLTSPPGVEARAEDHVRAIHQDDAGTIWFGTADAGLVRFRDGRTTRYTTASGLASNGVFAILDDGAGHFWTSSNRGLAQVSRRELDDFAEGRIPLVTARSFTRADGLRTLEANGGRQPSAFRGRDGRLWFATARGVAIVDPTRIPPGISPPAPVVDGVSVGGRVQMRPSAVDVPPGQTFVNVDYGVGVLSSPEVVRFRVRLVGLDDQWSDVGRQRSMTYSGLRPGSYRFEVAAVNAGLVGPATSLPIRVHPRFYETGWFGLLIVVFAGGAAGWVGHRRRTAQRQSQRREREFARRLLESQDRERERLAAEVHDGLGQHLLVIRNQALLGRQSSEDMDPCLEAIADTAAQSLDEVRAIAAALHPATLERLGLSRALAAMVRTLSRSTAVTITFDASGDRRLAAAVELQLYRIVQENLSNALRHAVATQVAVSIVFDDHEVAITVRDDGRGFSPSRVAERPEGSLGLSSIRQRAGTIGADLTLDSAPGKGTTVRVTVPLRGRRSEDRPV